MYAVIEDSGTQIKVSNGDVIKVALRDMPEDAATITFDRVLMLSNPAEEGAATRIGVPYVEGATVVADVLAREKGAKVKIVKFKRRKNSLRKRGHRQEYLKVKVTEING